MALIVANYTDADIIRQFSMWIYEHRSEFKDTILDVGCGIGILSCFLALILPRAQITALDCSEASIRIAEQIKSKLQISNIEFVAGSIQDLEDEQFDTVFSSRTFHENIRKIEPGYLFQSFSEQVAIYQNAYKRYCFQLVSKMKKRGRK